MRVWAAEEGVYISNLKIKVLKHICKDKRQPVGRQIYRAGHHHHNRSTNSKGIQGSKDGKGTDEVSELSSSFR